MLNQVNIGDMLPASTKEIDQERIMGWAALSGDYNKLHVDPEYARNTRFKGTIAHGPMSLGFLCEIMMACFNEGWAAGGRLLDVRFLAPIRPGDRIKVEGTVESIMEENGARFAECNLCIVKEDGVIAVTGRALGRIVEEA